MWSIVSEIFKYLILQQNKFPTSDLFEYQPRPLLTQLIISVFYSLFFLDEVADIDNEALIFTTYLDATGPFPGLGNNLRK